MAILRSKEIWDMEVDEIQEKLVELKIELSKNVSKSAAAGVSENPGKIRELKRTIARVLTILNCANGAMKSLPAWARPASSVPSSLAKIGRAHV